MSLIEWQSRHSLSTRQPLGNCVRRWLNRWKSELYLIAIDRCSTVLFCSISNTVILIHTHTLDGTVCSVHYVARDNVYRDTHLSAHMAHIATVCHYLNNTRRQFVHNYDYRLYCNRTESSDSAATRLPDRNDQASVSVRKMIRPYLQWSRSVATDGQPLRVGKQHLKIYSTRCLFIRIRFNIYHQTGVLALLLQRVLQYIARVGFRLQLDMTFYCVNFESSVRSTNGDASFGCHSPRPIIVNLSSTPNQRRNK